MLRPLCRSPCIPTCCGIPTYATTLYRAGVDLRTAQKLMGHSSIQVTADIYTHLEQEDSLHVADKLNEYLSGQSENSAKSSQKVVKLAI